MVLVVNAKGMREADHQLYRSANGVWLTETVPPAFPKLR